MSARRILLLTPALIGLVILVGCAAKTVNSLKDVGFSDQRENSDYAAKAMVAGGGQPNSLPTMAAPTGAAQAAVPGDKEAGAGGTPLIIKQAQLRLQVKDTDQAIDRLTQIVSDSAGYIVSNRVWIEQHGPESCKYATYTIGVPVDAFETTLRRLRSLAVKVVDETASGQDVSEEYVDLESRLHNLEATRGRIRGFLDQAQTVEESLRINNELSAIEEQIEQVKGRMNWLSSRAAFSTITVQFDPQLPDSPTPTPTPQPTPVPWDPGETFQKASGMAVKVGQFLVDMFIYLVVWLPFAIPALIVWFIYKIATRKRTPAQR
jgi:hypothetical protein